MAAANSPVMLPDDLLHAAEQEAHRNGVPLNEWLSSALAERLHATEEARNFFRIRAAKAKPGALLRALDAIPDHPPAPGDELEA
jgi:hypothetical protein